MSSTNRPRPVRCRASSTLGMDLPIHLSVREDEPLPDIARRFYQRPLDKHGREIAPVICGPLNVRGWIDGLRRLPSRLFEGLLANRGSLQHTLRFGDAQGYVCHASEHYAGGATLPVADVQRSGRGDDGVIPGTPGVLLHRGARSRFGKPDLHDHLVRLQRGYEEAIEEVGGRDGALAPGPDRHDLGV